MGRDSGWSGGRLYVGVLTTNLSTVVIALIIGFLSACTTIPVDERAEVRKEVDQAAAETIARMAAEDPTVQDSLNRAVGYLVGRMSATKVPIVGGGYGLAVLHDQERDTRTYLDITRFDLGAGLGAGRFSALMIFESREAMERYRGWHLATCDRSRVGRGGTRWQRHDQQWRWLFCTHHLRYRSRTYCDRKTGKNVDQLQSHRYRSVRSQHA